MRSARRRLNPESVIIAEKNSKSFRFQQKFHHPASERTARTLPASPLAYVLRKWRDKKELSARQAAATLGVPFDTYRGWEAGKHLPSSFARNEIKKIVSLQ